MKTGKTVDWTKDNPFANGSTNAFVAGSAKLRSVANQVEAVRAIMERHVETILDRGARLDPEQRQRLEHKRQQMARQRVPSAPPS